MTGVPPPLPHIAEEAWTNALTRRTRRLYQDMADNARAVTGARAVTLARVDRARARAVCVAFAASPAEIVARGMADLARVAPGYRPDRFVLPLALNPDCLRAFTQGRALLQPFGRIADGQKHQEALDVFRETFAFRFTLHVPILLGGEVVGALDFCFHRAPRQRQLEAAYAFTRQSQAFLKNARLTSALERQLAAVREARRRAVACDERARSGLAEILHGRVQGGLLAVGHRLQLARRMLTSDPAGADALLAATVAELDALREREVRQASHLLHPTVIAAGLRPAVAHLAERFAPVVRVRIAAAPELAALDDPLANRLPADLRLGVYRIIEEALLNVAQHAAATQATVTLDRRGPEAVVEVRDDGRGFDMSRMRSGLGLASAVDRAALLGGTLSVWSAPGHGTVVTARLPLRRV